ncbi:BlaR1 family beta-lactam sensor/signal transducer [Neobacillus piezotolerans]|uniref:BlaR1 family beta-lactam sensor/signal transducer n=1 Tax=Neobacillus piezotolerans TaxID=2259171 RepID=A0A3D8GQ59_9BACI|nr:BlaR1 family beta-lactam sensor/signal transducer [Neobacillus piezotolerans]RDU36630.1 BlaR1 family beta-lactam sensor/signal transducer [Neobacillus piezotolerans]
MDNMLLRILVSTIVVSLLIFIILLIKKLLNNHMTVKAHYHIWYLLCIPVLTAFLPWNYFRLGEGIRYLKSLHFFHKEAPFYSKRMNGVDASQAPNSDLLHDFTVSVNKSTPDFVYHTLFTVWFIGVALFVGAAVFSTYKIYKIRNSAVAIDDQKLNNLLEACKEMVGVKRNIRLRETSMISSPITFGIFQPYIFLPSKTREEFSLNELKYVLMHELHHHKSKDLFVNYVMWMFQIIYWFNPVVWYASKRIRIDRELACDASVLNLLDESGYIEYGHTIIRFADKKYDSTLKQIAPGIGGTNKQIKQRIQFIASYSRDSLVLKWKSKVICAVLGIVLLFLAPITNVIASPNDVYQFSGKNAVYEDLSSYFKDTKGSFVLYDPSKDQYQIYNREMSEQRISPDSTYKIYSAVFALESNVISPNKNKQVWDGEVYPFSEWNQNQNLESALSRSVNWYFQNTDREVGRKQLQDYFHKIKYGNEDLSGNLDNYWMESSLKISPIEQVQLLYKLEENQWGFKEENIKAVKKALLIDEQRNGRLYGKTGTGMVNGKNVNGWFIGFVDKGDDRFYFAINIQNKDGQAQGSKAAEIAKQILHHKKIY